MRFIILMILTTPIIAIEIGITTYINDSIYDGNFKVDVTRMGAMIDFNIIKENTPISFSTGLGSCEINNNKGIEFRNICRFYGPITDHISLFAGIGGSIIFLENPVLAKEVNIDQTITYNEMSDINFCGLINIGIMIKNNNTFGRFGIEASHISNGNTEPINLGMDTIGWFCEIGYNF